MNPLNIQRTRTAPEIKWLANELAATRGALQKLDATVMHLIEKRRQLQAQFDAMSNVAEQMAHPQLAAIVPAVKVHREYGKRGVLRGWLKELLRNAYPQPVDTTTLMANAEKAFGLQFASRQERDAYRKNTLTRQLRALMEQGWVERLHLLPSSNASGTPGGDAVQIGNRGVWRWKQELPSLTELQQQVAVHQAARE